MSDESILVVDDERYFREAIRDALESAQLSCVLAETGFEALECAEDEQIAVVILDIQLPDLNGIEVLRRLRETRPLLRVVILSPGAESVQCCDSAIGGGLVAVCRRQVVAVLMQ